MITLSWWTSYTSDTSAQSNFRLILCGFSTGHVHFVRVLCGSGEGSKRSNTGELANTRRGPLFYGSPRASVFAARKPFRWRATSCWSKDWILVQADARRTRVLAGGLRKSKRLASGDVQPLCARACISALAVILVLGFVAATYFGVGEQLHRGSCSPLTARTSEREACKLRPARQASCSRVRNTIFLHPG